MQTPGTGPAGPVFNPSELAHIYALCVANANAANTPIRLKIQLWERANNSAVDATGGFRDPARVRVTLEHPTP